jgi:hypothetical protein
MPLNILLLFDRPLKKRQRRDVRFGSKGHVQAMFGLLPTSDIDRSTSDVRFGLIADILNSFELNQ